MGLTLYNLMKQPPIGCEIGCEIGCDIERVLGIGYFLEGSSQLSLDSVGADSCSLAFNPGFTICSNSPMRFSNNICLRTSLIICIALGVVFATKAEAAPLPGNGGYLKVGIGYSPFARTALDVTDISVTSSGVAPSMVVGIVWDHYNSMDIRWQTVLLAESGDARQGYIALTYTRYLRKYGPAPFFDIGFGFQHGPSVGGVSRVNFETDDGFGFTVGAGLRFNKKLEVAADYSLGSTGRFFSANNNFDFSYQQLAFSLRYTLLGG